MGLKFKRYYPIIILLIATFAFLIFALGNQRIVAYTARADDNQASQLGFSRFDISNTTDLFDDSIVHNIQVMISQDDYDKMISTYQQTGLKEYFKADVIIDGVQVNDVGIRLKGNASLRTAVGGRGSGPGGNMPDFGERQPPNFNGERPDIPDQGFRQPPDFNGERPGAPVAGEMPEGDQPQFPRDGFQPPENWQMPEGGPQGGMNLPEEGEKKIPFMIKFDEFINDQTYQGYTAIAIRTYGISYNEALLQEPVSNASARLAGLTAAKTAYTGFQINGDDERLYVISELINNEFLSRNFENANGILYKAEIGSTLSYAGDNPSSYADSFTQQTRTNEADLKPLIDFIRFLDQADDATFERDLPQYLDVDAFATYLAVNVLLVNTDSLIGMNNNFYLYYDDEAGRFTLLLWDTNESLGKLGGNTSYPLDIPIQQEDTPAGPRGGRGGFAGGNNTLITRFITNDTFKSLYEEKLMLVYEQVFLSGKITAMVGEYSRLIHEVNDERNLVEMENYEQAVENTLTFINQRMDYLASTELLGEIRP